MTSVPENARPGQRFRRVRRARQRHCARLRHGPRRRRPAFRHRLRQVVVITPGGAQADAALRFYNADGGEVESCGNAARCVARLLMDERGLARVKLIEPGGLLVCSDAGNGLVTVDMGAPRLDWNEVPLASAADTNNFPLDVDGTTHSASAPSRRQSALRAVRATMRKRRPVDHAGSPDRNPSHVSQAHQCRIRQVLRPRPLRMRVWERGVGITLACGTGACATAVAAIRRGLADRKVEVVLDGGKLEDRMARRRRPCADDRSQRPCPSAARSTWTLMTRRGHHLRLPPQRL